MTTEQLMLFDIKDFTTVVLGCQKSSISDNDEQVHAKNANKEMPSMRPHHNHQTNATGIN